MLMITDQTRRVILDGAENVRDLGGYPTNNGKMTRWGKYYRGDSLHRLTITSQKTLYNLGIRTVIDLRFPNEGAYRFVDTVKIDYVNIPLHNPEQLKTEKPTNLVDLYRLILETKQNPIRKIMQLLAAAEDHAVLFHCKAGKDRTGVIAALLLDVAGVPHNIIAEDYALTNRYRTITEEMVNDRPPFMDESQYRSLLQCHPEYMLEFLEYLGRRYQNAAGYLKTIGLHPDEIRMLKQHIVDDQPG